MIHRGEIIRWAQSPEGTKVWESEDGLVWEIKSHPIWNPSNYYVVDDKHAQMRMKWFAEGKPPMQYLYPVKNKWVDIKGVPSWGLGTEYRFKPMWYSKIPKRGILCYVHDDGDSDTRIENIVEYAAGDEYPFKAVGAAYQHAKPLTLTEVTSHIYTEKD